MARSLDNVTENNARVGLSCPSERIKRNTVYMNVNTKRKFKLLILRVKAMKMEIPNAKRGGAVVDNDGSGRRKVIEIRLSLDFRYEWHVDETKS